MCPPPDTKKVVEPPKHRREETFDETQQKKVAEIKAALQEYARTQNEQGKLFTKNLEDRIKRGLDPIGMLAIPETRAKAEQLVEKIGTDMLDLETLALEIQNKGPWNVVDELNDAYTNAEQTNSPAARAWIMMLAADTMNKPGGEREIDLTEAEFFDDVQRINGLLDEAVEHPEAFWERTLGETLRQQEGRSWEQKATKIVKDKEGKDKTVVDEDSEGVYFSEMKRGFIMAALGGRREAVLQDGDGLLHVGMAEKIDDSLLESWGLRIEERTDRGRPNIPFYVNAQGEAIAKKLYPGYMVVLNRQHQFARAVALGLEEVPKKALEYKIYVQSSDGGQGAAEMEGWTHIKDTKRVEPWEGQSFEDPADQRLFEFLSAFGAAKARENFRNAMKQTIRQKREDAIRIANETGKPRKKKAIVERDLQKEGVRTEKKINQKMQEAMHMVAHLAPELVDLKPGSYRVIDMAGGAGDVALTAATEMVARDYDGIELEGVSIVDPWIVTEKYCDLLLDEVPHGDELRELTTYERRGLQDREIAPNEIVVAKHACGDLADGIIENWLNSESPILIMMTCCQGKACDCAARYNIPQETWHDLCLESDKTKSSPETNPAEYLAGMRAMTELDKTRTEHLNRLPGITATLTNTEKFPKGDVIVVRRDNSRRETPAPEAQKLAEAYKPVYDAADKITAQQIASRYHKLIPPPQRKKKKRPEKKPQPVVPMPPELDSALAEQLPEDTMEAVRATYGNLVARKGNERAVAGITDGQLRKKHHLAEEHIAAILKSLEA